MAFEIRTTRAATNPNLLAAPHALVSQSRLVAWLNDRFYQSISVTEMKTKIMKIEENETIKNVHHWVREWGVFHSNQTRHCTCSQPPGFFCVDGVVCYLCQNVGQNRPEEDPKQSVERLDQSVIGTEN